jgi:hypothetical protein
VDYVQKIVEKFYLQMEDMSRIAEMENLCYAIDKGSGPH